MNTSFQAALGLLVLCFTVLRVSAAENHANTSVLDEHVRPLACNAFALSPETRARHFDELGPALLKLKKTTRELADGYEFAFPANEQIYQLLTEWMFQEHLCCPFFNIELRLESQGGPMWLRLTGGHNVKESIQSDAPAWINP